MKLSIAVPVYNGLEDLKKCLASIYDSYQEVVFEVIVVDDGSTDGSASYVRDNYPQVQLIINQQNLGLSRSTNRAIALSSGKYFLRMDADAQVTDGALDVLHTFMEDHPQVGAAGPQLLFPDGRFQRSYFLHWPTPGRVFIEFCFAFNRIMERLKVGGGQSGESGINSPQEVGHVIGAAMIIRREAIDKVGMMDAQIPFFRDETDLQYRIYQAGWQIWYVPTAVFYHRGGQSSGARYIFARSTNLVSFWNYNRKHYPRLLDQVRFFLAVLAGTSISLVVGLVLLPLPSSEARQAGRKIMRDFSFILNWHVQRAGRIMLGKPLTK